MRSITKALAVGAVAVPFIAGGAGAAFADSGPVYAEQTSVATERGAAEHGTLSGFFGDGGRSDDSRKGGMLGGMLSGWSGTQNSGGPSYAETGRMAGPDGASSGFTASGVDARGDAFYAKGHQHAGPHGAGSTTVASHS
ncbi:hypothetical protein ACFC7A_38420 [Streptomyces niveus]|uniref:hypothetical protein n=1 Tax=Streptomyces niveus TaxID=193462 RepID=UPI00344A50D0